MDAHAGHPLSPNGRGGDGHGSRSRSLGRSEETFAFGTHPRAPFAEKLQRRLACGTPLSLETSTGPISPNPVARTLFIPPRAKKKAPPAAEMLATGPGRVISRSQAPGRWPVATFLSVHDNEPPRHWP